MLSVKEIIEEAESLPIEERMLVVDKLLRSLNPLNCEMEDEWLKIAKHRLNEIRTGKVKPVPGKAVLAKIRERLSL